MKQSSKYKTLNISPDAFSELQQLAKLLSNDYSKVKLGNLVAQLITEKHLQLTTKK